MTEIKHVPFDKCLLYFLVCPVDEQFIVKIGFFGQTSAEVYWVLQPSSVPICLEQYTKFLSTTKGKHWYQDFTTFIKGLMQLSQKLSSLDRLLSLIVVAYVVSVMTTSGPSLSIQAAPRCLPAVML